MRPFSFRHLPRQRAVPLTTFLAATALTIGAVAAPASGALAATASPVRVQLKVLVIDDGAAMTAAVTDRLDKEFIPVERIDLRRQDRPKITHDLLVGRSGGELVARYSGVVTPDDALAGLSAEERHILTEYEVTFGVREVVAYAPASPSVGLKPGDQGGYVGSLDGLKAHVTKDAQGAEFGYLAGELTMDDVDPKVNEIFGAASEPVADEKDPTSVYTPFLRVDAPGGKTGSILGVHTRGGRERLVTTFTANQYMRVWRILSHGIVTWLTRGMSTSLYRNQMSVHIDDIFLEDALWNTKGKCTHGGDCDPDVYPATGPGTHVRMTPQDVTKLRLWVERHKFQLDMTYNGRGVEIEVKNNGRDKLYEKFGEQRNKLRWMSHTWSHKYLGCIQDSSTIPWKCRKDDFGNTQWVPAALVTSELEKNLQFAKDADLPSVPDSELVTGEHSGLRTLPQMSDDNPDLVKALSTFKIAWVGSDASREPLQRKIGSALTVPRHPMNIFYNVATEEQEVDEWNWIYTSKKDGGSGLCEHNPASMCLPPLDLKTGFKKVLAPREAYVAFQHMVDNDPRPHYAHQSNLAADGLLYTAMDIFFDDYRRTFAGNTPVVNPRMSEVGRHLQREQAWRTGRGNVEASLRGRTLSVRNRGTSAIDVPLTMPKDAKPVVRSDTPSVEAGLEPYAGSLSGWTSTPAGKTLDYRLSRDSGFADAAVWANDRSTGSHPQGGSADVTEAWKQLTRTKVGKPIDVTKKYAATHGLACREDHDPGSPGRRR